MLVDLKQSLGRIERLDSSEREIYGARRKRPVQPDLTVPGYQFFCPVCGGRFRRFLPFGLNGRRNARCPGCGSLERHRFLWLWLLDRHRLDNRRVRILHVAPEPCIRNVLGANPALRYVSADMFDLSADRAADLTDLPFADARFDLVICSHVLEHVKDDRSGIAELYRVLAPGGHAVVMVPLDMTLAHTYEDPSIDTAAGRDEAFGHPYHVRVCGADYPERLKEAGFSVESVGSGKLPTHYRRLQRINKTWLFDCRKPPVE